VFIKELLRKKGRIGATKEDFARNLESAIDDGALGLADIRAWLERVVGWGQQHIYLWDASSGLARSAKWRNATAIREAVAAAGMGDQWDAPVTHTFPPALKLIRVTHADGMLGFEWHEGESQWVRAPDKNIDPQLEDDGETYKYEAYRQTGERRVMRFVFRPGVRVAAAFVPIPVTTAAHATALATMVATVAPLVPRDQLKPFNVARAISRLDEAQVRGASNFSTQTTRLSGQGAYVEFGSTVPGHGYREVESIRDVRLAVQVDRVAGKTATITFSAPGDAGPARDIRVQFYGEDARIWVRARLTSEQIWVLLDQIRAIDPSR
jgi:hypothetical protein